MIFISLSIIYSVFTNLSVFRPWPLSPWLAYKGENELHAVGRAGGIIASSGSGRI